jgi:hypothetical protein
MGLKGLEGIENIGTKMGKTVEGILNDLMKEPSPEGRKVAGQLF